MTNTVLFRMNLGKTAYTSISIHIHIRVSTTYRMPSSRSIKSHPSAIGNMKNTRLIVTPKNVNNIATVTVAGFSHFGTGFKAGFSFFT